MGLVVTSRKDGLVISKKGFPFAKVRKGVMRKNDVG